MTCALRSELAPFGIIVGALRLGDVKTGFTAARQKSGSGDDLYAGRIARSVAVMERDEQNGMSRLPLLLLWFVPPIRSACPR